MIPLICQTIVRNRKFNKVVFYILYNPIITIVACKLQLTQISPPHLVLSALEEGTYLIRLNYSIYLLICLFQKIRVYKAYIQNPRLPHKNPLTDRYYLML